MSPIASNTTKAPGFAANYANPFAAKTNRPAVQNVVQNSIAQHEAIANGTAPMPKASPQGLIQQHYAMPKFAQQPAKFADLMHDLDGTMLDFSQEQTQIAQANDQAKDSASGAYSVLDVIDMINPLQHIPVVSNIYRAITGDTIRQETRVAGNMVFGVLSGPAGLAVGMASAAVDMTTNKPVGDHMLAWVAPNLEETLREDYSIAGFFENPFGKGDATQLAGAQEATAAPIKTTQHLQSANEASQVYAQTASILGQKLNKPIPLATSSSSVAQAQQMALPAGVSSFASEESIVAQSIPNLMGDPAKEAQALAKSVAHNPSTVVQLSADAAAQLSSLAAGTANTHELNANLLGMTGDSASQLRAAAAKNRQLGIALNSSANISQQISQAEQRQISLGIGDKVAALYDQNYVATQQAIESAKQASARGLVNQRALPSFDQDLSNDQQALFDQPSAPNAAKSAAQVQQQLAVSRTLKPNQLGENYHNAHAVGNLSIAAAMQQALDKYQTLRKN